MTLQIKLSGSKSMKEGSQTFHCQRGKNKG